ncbi:MULTISPECIES: VOC family protein [unclassified Microbacterium]|uniref:VOC family protein n=1 Tax=unclassified Microbacterium TaxID=2609290 RepID=UPI00301ADAF8
MTSDLRALATSLDQIGVVVRDADAAAEGMRRIFGLEPRLRTTNRYTGAAYRGATIDTEVEALFYDLFGIEIEFLCPLGGPDIWQEFVDAHGGGLHHIRFAVEDHDAVVAAMAGIGVPVHQEGDSVRGGGVRYAYFDARPSLGFFLEILSTPR